MLSKLQNCWRCTTTEIRKFNVVYEHAKSPRACAARLTLIKTFLAAAFAQLDTKSTKLCSRFRIVMANFIVKMSP